MILDNTLDLVLPTNQWKHLPRSQLQGTKRDRVWVVCPIGPDVSTRGYHDDLAACLPTASLAVWATPDTPDGYSKSKIKT